MTRLSVPSQAPPGYETLVGHLHGAEPDGVDRGDIPAQMMQPRTLGFDEGDDVVVAAVNGVHEGDHLAGAVGQA